MNIDSAKDFLLKTFSSKFSDNFVKPGDNDS